MKANKEDDQFKSKGIVISKKGNSYTIDQENIHTSQLRKLVYQKIRLES